MANPTPAAVTWLRSQVTDWAPDDASLAAALNAELSANPAVCPQVPRPMDALSLIAHLSPESCAKLEGAQLITEVNRAIAAAERETVQRWVIYSGSRGHITPDEYAALLAELAEQVPDPEWSAEVPAPVVALGRTVDADDLAAARDAEASDG